MHKILNVTAFLYAGDRRGVARHGGGKCASRDSVNEHAVLHAHFSNYGAFVRRQKGGLRLEQVGVVEQVAVHNNACVHAGNFVPVRCAAAVMRYE